MKNLRYFIPVLSFWAAACMEPNNTLPDTHNATPAKEKLTTPVNQLFVFQETEAPGACENSAARSGVSLRSGAMYLTEKGNVIYHTIDEQRDTQSYFWGKYQLTDSSIVYQLTDEYYYPGKWDASWAVDDPDYAKGRSRKISASEIVLYRTACDSLTFYRTYPEAERVEAAKRYQTLIPKGLDFWRYYETPNMKFYTWLFKQIPALRDL